MKGEGILVKGVRRHLDGEGDEGELFAEVGLVADVVFVEAGDDMVAMGGDVAVERLLGGAQPVALLPDGTSRYSAGACSWCTR